MAQLQALTDPEVGTTIISQIELLRGRFDYLLKAATGTDLLRAQSLLVRTEQLRMQLLIVPLDAAAASRFDRLRVTKGLAKVGRADLLIAAIALTYGAVLVTRNTRHFRQIPNLRIINWVD
ncbi:MAG: type II toxin-antitoxin system VapC family toxin [Chloroflexota bacterium]|nr:type II toxin-antitoxin system VapC family toxin [Chloroflexota bacterium]